MIGTNIRSNTARTYTHITNHTTFQPPNEQLKAAMDKYHLTEFIIARQLNLSVGLVKSYLDGRATPAYVEKRVKEWLE